MDNTLTTYDYLAFQIFWEGTRKFSTRTDIEKKFLSNFMYKYQIMVLCEEEYSRPDKEGRVRHILSHLGDTNLAGLGLDRISEEISLSFKSDLDLLLGSSVNESVANTPLPVAVMGMGDDDDLPPTPRRAKDEVVRTYTHDEKGVTRNKSARQQLLEDHEVKTKDEYIQKQISQIQSTLDDFSRQTSMALRIQYEALSRKIEGTNTQLDGVDILDHIQTTREMDRKVEKLIDLTMGGKDWSEVRLKDIPKFLKIKFTAGLKRVAVETVLFPVWTGPKAIVNGMVITPLKLVAKRVNSLLQIVQEIWGWAMIGFLIGGVWVIMYHPEYDEQRQKLYETYATGIQYIPVSLLEPSKQTFQFIMDAVPGKKFFQDVLEVMSSFLSKVPGVVLEWFWNILQAFLASAKQFLVEAVNNAVSAGWEKLKPSSWFG